MNFLTNAAEYLLGGPKVGGAAEERLRRWIALPEQALALPHARSRYVVIDTETSGRDPRRDRLMVIGAVGVEQARIDLVDCFAVVLRQEGQSAGAGSVADGNAGPGPAPGVAPELGLLDFLEYLGKAPLVAFDTGIDRAVVERAMKSILGVPFRRPWIDLAALLPVLFPDAGCTTRTQWLDRFGLAPGARRDALGDALVTAQLFLAALEAATRAGIVNAVQLTALRPPRR